MLYDNTVVILLSLFCHMGSSRPFIFSLLLIFLPGLEESKADVNVTTSVRPLQLIAQAIVEDRGEVTAVIDGQDSPHHYSLTPSDRLNLQRADLLLWISPEFEVQLSDVFAALADEKPVLAATEVTGISLLSLSGDHIDPHLWLNSANAIVIAKSLAENLQEIDSVNSVEYQNAFSRFEANISRIKLEIGQQLSAVDSTDYVVFHDAYQYFEKEFALGSGLVLVNNAEAQPSMRELLRFRNDLRARSPSCILLEPDSNLELVASALENRNLPRETVDLLGYEIEDGSGAYGELMLGVAAAFDACLSN
ncbi:MAG: hypothetical protein GKR91_16535 [Pseudomonadales bacterium]|nr:hypothetical protein [Pseudomonadales bacterium]